MTRTIKFNSGINSPLPGKRVTLGVSRLALAASTETPKWGQTSASTETPVEGGTGAGTVAITVRTRSNQQCAPDSIRFTVDLSAAAFDTPARWVHPGGDFRGLGTPGDLAHEAYDARLHDLLFFWDFGYDRTYQWTPMGNVLNHWKNARWATGPFVSHVYTMPGTYTVSLTVVEPSSGKVATATTSVTVAHADERYPGTRTICVNPDGDSDFSAAPDGAQKIYASNFNSHRKSQSEAQPLRWLLKRGGSYNLGTIKLWPNRSGEHGAPDFYLGEYGDPVQPMPKVTAPAWTQIQPVNYGLTHNQDIRISNVDFDGNLDLASADLGIDSSDTAKVGLNSTVSNKFFAAGDDNLDIIISGCKIQRFYNQIVNWQGTTHNATHQHLHFDDCSLTEFRGKYLILTSNRLAEDTSFSFTGNYYVGSKNLPGENDLTESIIRLATWQHTYIAKNDLHTPATTNALMKIENSPDNSGNFDLTNATTAENSGPWIHGRIFNIHNNTMEGQVAMITNCRTTKNGGGAQNGIIDGNIFITGPNTTGIIETGGQGVTIRNNLMWVPNKPHLRSAMERFIRVDRFTYTQTTETYWYNLTLDSGETTEGSDFWVWETRPWPGMAPIRIYNNTMVYERSSGSVDLLQSGSLGYVASPYAHMEAVFEANNVFHAPAAGVSVSGLDTTTYLPFKPHYVGPKYWDNNTKTHTPPVPGNPYAIDGLNIPTFAPLAESPVLGAALTGDTAYQDIEGNWRPAYPSMGAWETPKS